MLAGCPLDARLWGCLYRTYPEILYFAAAIVAGFFILWGRWAPVLLGLVFLGVAALLKVWGVLP
ncbi:MAG: hypothetical protein RMI94_07145 [Bryobacterales bacterium]|nr:hypothetical protein [Bryobacterales bacterium]